MNANALPVEDPGPRLPAAGSAAVNVRRTLMVIIALTALAVFSDSFRAAFVPWDDNFNIYNNPHLRHGLSFEGLRWMFTDAQYVPRYMPLGWLSWAVNYQIDGFNPAGFHLGNLLLHATNSVLVFLLLNRVLSLVQARLNRVGPAIPLLYCSAFGALLWAVHPLRVESVAWASARLYQQALFFLLLSALAYLKAHDGFRLPRQRRVLLHTSVAMFLCSLLTYPLALGFVFILLCIDICLLDRFPAGDRRWWNATARAVWFEKIPFGLAIVAVLGLTLAARINSADWGRPPSLSEFTLAERAMQAFYVWAYYIWKPWVPLNLTPMPSTLISFDPWSLPFLASAALVLGVSALLWWRRRSWSGALALWVCYLIFMVPMLGLSEHPHFSSDRYSFIVSILWSVLLSAGLLKLWKQMQQQRLAMVAACAAVLVALAADSFRLCHVWHNERQLLPHILASLGNHPARARVDVLYGVTLMGDRDWRGAEEAFRNAIRSDERCADAWANLGEVLTEQGRPAEAIAHYERALVLKPAGIQARQGLAVALGTLGRFQQAAAQFKEVLRDDANNANALHNLALTVHQLGETNLSRAYYALAQQMRREQNGR